MTRPMITISLPVESRTRAHAFYSSALGLEMVGEPMEDGMSEPLQFALGPQTLLMLIPADGFGWVLGSGRLAPSGSSECILSLSLPDEAGVRAFFRACIDAGAAEIRAPGEQAWGHEAMIADPDGHLWMFVAGTEA